MALVQNALIGRASGSVGNTTFTTWKGKNVLKTKAVNAYSNPSNKQLFNNLCFMKMVALFRSIAILVTLGFKELAIGKSEYNAFMQQNPYTVAITGTGENAKIDTQNLIISKGSLNVGFNGLTKLAEGANGISCSFNYNSSIDLLRYKYGVVAFNRTTGMVLTTDIAGTLDDFTIISSPGMGTAIATTDVYLFIYDTVTGKVTDSLLAV